MISESRKTVEILLMEETENCSNSKVLELRRKIHDKDYINNAVQRIAQVISKKLVERSDELKFQN